MTQLIVNDVIQVSVDGTIGGRAITNVFHVDASRPINGNSESIATKVLAAYQDRLVPLFSTGYTCLGARYIDLDSLVGDSGQVATVAGEPVVGARADGAPPQVSVLVRKNVSNAPRGRSWRMFLPPPGDADISGVGLLTATYSNLVQAALDAFRDDIDEEDGPGVSRMNLCCVSYPRSSSGEVTGPGTAYDLTSYAVQERVATQRRRLRG